MNNAQVQEIEAPVADAPAVPIEQEQLKKIVEGLLMAAGKPLSVADIAELFLEQERPEAAVLKEIFAAIAMDCEQRGFELKEVASGFRFQVKQELSTWVGRLWEERPQRYTRALLETLALIAYRQPITRGDIEEIRGVGVSSTIIRTLLDREWIRVVGHRDVPGRPAMFATTRQFLDYFGLKSLQQLPPLSEIRDLDQLNRELELEDVLGDMRVLELPSEAELTADNDDEFSAPLNENEYPDEHEAIALARRPLDEILGISSAPKESLTPSVNPSPIDSSQEENNSDR